MPEFTKQILNDLFSKSKVLKVKFFKKYGSIREMICTTEFPEVPKKDNDPEKPSRPTPDHLFLVYDLEKKAPRAFTIDTVVSVKEV